ncbi:MAG: molybdopterin-dependent oxidoreductase [Alphaproteobacteria bacterium]|nr:molybdopterin-dependent oxidoreductase [Alphaproteobacteria bacterium]MBT5161035.1 molybdopterin-dependent oxidoreductase [Alphaproteobacteria bacterium]MBT5917410.1 molybdopterin-dependent oxidoreductase [Alphaproteobacteria bacterium]MBT6385993.1 molybdopterin-dependent oxidoreductase [Alphaproteobacteria bacterium]
MPAENTSRELPRELPSVCPMDCPDTCSLLVTVENDQVVKVRGSHTNPLTNGVICNKISRGYPEFVHGPNRLTVPLKRVGPRGEGKFEQISWDEALDTVVERISAVIDEHGPQAVLPFNYAGPHGKISAASMDARLFNKMGASQLDRGPLCAGVRGLAYASLYGGMPGTPMEQAQHSKLIVIWGNNVTVSNLHLSGLINKAKKNGAKLVVIDPKRIKIAGQADLHLALTPGTDVVLAMAVAAELERLGGIEKTFVDQWVHGFDAYMEKAREVSIEDAAETCGLKADDIRAFAKMYCDLSPAIMSIANGMERSRNGGASIRAAAVLPALAGKFGVPGGGLIMKAGGAFPDTAAKLQGSDMIPAGTRKLNIIDVPDHILDDSLAPPLKALFIYNHNPLAVHPDQNRMIRALSREDVFIVGCDIAMTDSMAYADIILPASSHFEFDDVYGAYGQQYLQRAEPVIPRVGESLPNTEIFRRLAARFGYDEPIFRADDKQLMDDALDGNDARLEGFKPSEIPLDQSIYMLKDGEEFSPFHNVFPDTQSGKIELLSERLGDKYGEALPAYKPLASDFPLFLISPSSDKRINATFGGLSMSDGLQPLEMHPDDAASRNLDNGMTVRTWNDLGEVHLALVITDAVPAGTLYSPKGAWFRTSETGQTVSALISGAKADIAEGACYNDARVEVSALNH